MNARSLAVVAAFVAGAAIAQQPADPVVRSEAGLVALRQAQLDAGCDAVVLLVASHPDDRYVLPGVHLRFRHGARAAVLLATRGGGGQNSQGPETGDELERIRTLEAEAGCARFQAQVRYLNRPDRGFRRTAQETFVEWGRSETVRELARHIREVRPDVVVSTHHGEETHGHDLALAELLPEAVALAADEGFEVGAPPHAVRSLFLGATSTVSALDLVLEADEFEPVRGETCRRLAYDILLHHHVSPGLPAPFGSLFEAQTRFRPTAFTSATPPLSLLDGLQSPFADAAADPKLAELGRRLAKLREVSSREQALDVALALARDLAAIECDAGSDLARRRDLRLSAVHDVIRHANLIQVEAAARAGAAAVPGEELALDVRIHVGGQRPVRATTVSAPHGLVLMEPIDGEDTSIRAGGSLQALVRCRLPLDSRADAAAQDRRFRGDRYEAPLSLRFDLQVDDVRMPVQVDVPVELRPPVQLTVVPRMLLLPATRQEVKFTVKAERFSKFAVSGELDLKAPAGYRIEGARTSVSLDSVRSDIFEFSLVAPSARQSGVDRVRIALGNNRVVLPVHKVEVQIDPATRIGVVRSQDDALTSVIGAGGFGLAWSGLGDIDLTVGDLDSYDVIVIDVRALRDRPRARESYRRVVDIAAHKGKRLVVFYHKDSEYEPPGEGFRGAPFLPFQIGKGRVTRSDAPVRVRLPRHALLTAPNTVRAEDWDGWEQERGLYFPGVYAAEYEELIEIADPGQQPQSSSLLYARCGEGEFVYCALSLWRQLKKLHPGAVRLLANLLTPNAAPN